MQFVPQPSHELARNAAVSALQKWVLPIAAAALSIGVFIAVPRFTAPYVIILMTSILMYIVLSVSWTVFCAPSQYFSLGIAAFFGVGIYTYAILANALPSAPLPLLLLVAGISSSILAFFVGLTTLRIKGMYFAIFTFGLSELLRHLVMWWEVNMTGTVGRWIAIVEDVIVYRYMAVLAVVTVLIAYLLRRSRYGLALRSIGDGESASEHVGVNVSAVKIAVFAGSCFFTGAAGALIATRWTYIDADFAFDPIRNMFTIMMSLFGGMDILIGPILGAVSIGTISDVVLARLPQFSRLLLGLLLVVVVLFIPQGLAGVFSSSMWRSVRARLKREEPGKGSHGSGGQE
jgi:branched-chain amino acid transport system permease protein